LKLNEKYSRIVNKKEFTVSECSLPIQFDISYIISTAKKLSDWSYSLSSKLNKAKNDFINADNAGGSLISSVGISSGITSSLYRGESAAEKLAKYKSISILTNKKTDSKLYENNWDKLMDYWHNVINDKTPPLSRLGIGEIPSSSDVVNTILSSVTTFTFGTVLGNADKITKKGAYGYITDENCIKVLNLNPKNSLATYNPYTKEAEIGGKIACTVTIGTIALDLGNTWSAYSGNTVKKRFEKTGIQLVGDGSAWLGGKVTEALASFGAVNIEDPIGVPCIIVRGHFGWQ
jgi:hypothetical protein